MKKLTMIPLFASVLLAGAAQAAPTGIVNLVTKDAGVHRISYEQLVAKGVDLAGVNSEQLAISRAGTAIQRYVSDADGNGFGAGDSIEFLATDAYTRYSDDSVYTLHIDEALSNDFLSGEGVTYTGQAATSATSFYQLQERNQFWGSTNPNLLDPFVNGYLVGTSNPVNTSYDIDLESPDNTGGEVVISAIVSGGFADLHQVTVSINEQVVAEAEFKGFERRTITGKVPASILKATGNEITVELPLEHDAPLDIVAVESINVSYPSVSNTTDDSLTFRASNGLNVATGLSSDNVSVYQVSRGGVSRLNVEASQSDAGYGVAFNSVNGATTYIAGEQGALTPEIVNVVDVDETINSGEGEYLIISHADFIGPKLNELVNLRSGEYSTKVVDVAQIYTQYGLGVPSADAIKKYIEFAYENLGTKMVVLVGGDTYDYQNYVSDSISHIPTLYTTVKAVHTMNHSPSDAAFGDIDVDGVPDIAVGRLPVRTLEELDNVISKIAAYEQRDYDDIIFATDAIDNGANYDFDKAAADVVSDLNASNLEVISVEELGVDQAKINLINSINEGAALTSWFGHSNINQWSSGGFLTTADVSALENTDKPTVMTQFGCWNAYFVNPDGNSMAVTSMVTGKNGAATVLGSATLSVAPTEVALAEDFFNEAISEGKTIGDALIEAKQELGKSSKKLDVLLGWQIIGDPALKITAK